MYLVDTSAWIHALRPGGNPAIRSQLKPLLVGGEALIHCDTDFEDMKPTLPLETLDWTVHLNAS